MTPAFSTHRLRLTPLSPIHIGSGVDLDWTQTVLDDGRMLLFDPLRAALPAVALKEMERAASQPDAGKAMVALQKIFRTHQRALAAARTGSIQLTPAVHDKFERSLGRNVQAAPPRQSGGRNNRSSQQRESVINSLTLARTAIDAGTGLPYVPGTGLKGVLRTAEVARIDAEQYRGTPQDRKDPSDQYLGSFKTSSFSRVMLSDLLPTGDVPGIAATIRSMKRKDGEGDGVPVTAECIPPFELRAYQGEIRMGASRGPRDPVQQLPDVHELLRATHHFHAQLFQQFAEYWQHRDLPPDWLPTMQRLLQNAEMVQAFDEGRAALVRLGKYGSAESKTVARRSVRNHKTKQPMLNPATFWLVEMGANNWLPPGWALLELGDTSLAPLADFCTDMGGEPSERETAAEEAIPTISTIITDDSNPTHQRMAMLEDGYDKGKPNDPLLERVIKESRNWSDEDRLLLARLVAEKARANSKLGFKWKDLQKLLLPWPPA